MSIEALETLTNSRDTIISIVCEHYFLSKDQIRRLRIHNGKDHECNDPVEYHGLWRFCYHRHENTVYLRS